MFIASVCPSVRPSVCLSVWNQNLVVWKQNLTMMQGPRSGPEKLRVRSMNSLVFTAWVPKNKLVGPACFLASKRFLKRTADWKINRLASMLPEPLVFFSAANTPSKKIRRVAGKQAVPWVTSGFWIHRTHSKFGPTFYVFYYSARHLNPTFLYGGFFNLNEVSRAK